MNGYYIEPHHYEEANRNHISENNLNNRVYHRGWTIDRAITQPVRGKTSHDWNQWQEQSKVSKQVYMRRVREGWEKEKAALIEIITPKENVKAINQSRSMFTPEQVEIMKKNNISRSAACMRVNKLKWSKDDAVSIPVIGMEESMRRARKKSYRANTLFVHSKNFFKHHSTNNAHHQHHDPSTR